MKYNDYLLRLYKVSPVAGTFINNYDLEINLKTKNFTF